METIAVPKHEWQELNETVQQIFTMLKGKPVKKEWVRMAEFMEITGKNRNQVDHLCTQHMALKRSRKGEGVQINLKLYNQLYQ